ncbi:MAG TPA: hypothetical protein VHD95_10125, partial [Rhizomicrobium sp.]|nr:hypothetical protein [Rhizomicrobium sp.]
VWFELVNALIRGRSDVQHSQPKQLWIAGRNFPLPTKKASHSDVAGLSNAQAGGVKLGDGPDCCKEHRPTNAALPANIAH